MAMPRRDPIRDAWLHEILVPMRPEGMHELALPTWLHRLRLACPECFGVHIAMPVMLSMN